MKHGKHSTKIPANSICPCRIKIAWANDAVEVEISDRTKYKKCCGFKPSFKDVTADIALGQKLVEQYDDELKARLSPEQWATVTTPPKIVQPPRFGLGATLAASAMAMNLYPLSRFKK